VVNAGLTICASLGKETSSRVARALIAKEKAEQAAVAAAKEKAEKEKRAASKEPSS
jgi:hypothetical protein